MVEVPAYFDNIKNLVYWLPKDLDPTLRDLFKKVFAYDSQRASLQEIKNHDWLKF